MKRKTLYKIDTMGGIRMKSKIALEIENKRLKKRNEELESKIENINQMYNYNLKSLHDELTGLLGVLYNDKA